MNRFWSKVKKGDGCWEWMGAKTHRGYGLIRIDGKTMQAHRVVLELEGIDIPSGMCVCHSCDNPSCVNPDHLWLGTQADNVRDMLQKNRAVDPKGSRHHNAKLCELDVWLIRNCEGVTNVKLAEFFGVHHSQIARIRRGEQWTHVGLEA